MSVYRTCPVTWRCWCLVPTLCLEAPFRSLKTQHFLAVRWGWPQSWSHHRQALARGCCPQTPLGFPPCVFSVLIKLPLPESIWIEYGLFSLNCRLMCWLYPWARQDSSVFGATWKDVWSSSAPTLEKCRIQPREKSCFPCSSVFGNQKSVQAADIQGRCWAQWQDPGPADQQGLGSNPCSATCDPCDCEQVIWLCQASVSSCVKGRNW